MVDKYIKRLDKIETILNPESTMPTMCVVGSDEWEKMKNGELPKPKAKFIYIVRHPRAEREEREAKNANSLSQLSTNELKETIEYFKGRINQQPPKNPPCS